MKVVVSHPTANEFSRALVQHFHAEHCLHTFFTAMASEEMSWLINRLPAGMQAELSRRKVGIPSEKLRTHPLRETVRLASKRLKLDSVIQHETGWASIDAVYSDMDRYVAKSLAEMVGVDAVYCYEDGALETFRAARERGIFCAYDLPIAYWKFARDILLEEALRLPRWEPTLVGTRDSDEKRQRKSAEIELADVVICPSRFVERSLQSAGIQNGRTFVSEFGSPSVDLPEKTQRSSKLRVLFAGSMTQRKGLADVFAAFKILHRIDVELVVMGSPVVGMDFYRQEYPDFSYEAPRPHADVLMLMSQCDALVLPSLVEGRALVQQEAMACGLPIIVTANAGGEDLVRESETGFMVPIRSPEAIAEKLEWLADHRDAVAEMGHAARALSKTLTWKSYAQRIRARLSDAIGC